MGTEKFYEYIYNFGFGKNTGIDFSTDGAGIVRAAKYIKNVDLARIGFGQSIACTPLQLATAACAVVNGGLLYQPRLAAGVQNSEGEMVESFDTPQGVRVISEETSAAMRQILESVVANGGGKNAQIPGYRVGGKTGTAQMYEDGVIVQGKNISSFIGFAPADDPQFLVLFIVREPGVPVTYGSVVAAPFAKDVLESCLKYANIQPSEQVDNLVEVPDFSGMDLAEAEQKAKEAGFSASSFGTGAVAAQSPAAGTKIAGGSTIDLYGNSSETQGMNNTVTAPDLKDKTLFEAFQIAGEHGLEIKVSGSEEGKVRTQSPAAGEQMEAGGMITVTCG